MILIKNVLTSTRRQPELAFSSPPSMMSTQGTRQMEKPLGSDSMAHDAFLDYSPYKDAKVDGKANLAPPRTMSDIQPDITGLRWL